MFGYSPADTYGMTMLEEVLDLVSKWKPMQSSNTQNTGDTSEGGRPKVDDEQLSDAGSASRDGDNRNKNA
jgi:hypothetical protein